MRLADQLKEAIDTFEPLQQRPALIGGLALGAHHVVRSTRDIDFLADADDGDRLHALLQGLGYRCIYRSTDAANYLRGDEGLDLLYAHRPEARRLLETASDRDTPMGRIRVIGAEGLIASAGRSEAPALLRDPFVAWIELMEVVEMLCPKWPERAPVVGGVYRL
jgi:hypothetical protein